LYKRFFTNTSEERIKAGTSKAFLNKCCKLEKMLLPFMHFLLGSTNRGTDYEQLTFRNWGRDLPARVIGLDDEHFLVDTQSRKTSMLRNTSQMIPKVIQRKWFEHAAHYWVYVRPFCCLLARGLGRPQGEVERWQRFCFVKSSSKVVTEAVQRQVVAVSGAGATFQRLRHAAESLFRKHVVPQELILLNQYDIDKLFGHSYKTGVSYGTRMLRGSEKRHSETDISSVVRCLKAWVNNVLNLGEPESVLLEEEEEEDSVDDVESVEDEESSEGETSLDGDDSVDDDEPSSEDEGE
jgi:hypothetical protein